MPQELTISSLSQSTSGRFQAKPNAIPFGDYVAPMLFIWYNGSGDLSLTERNDIEALFNNFLTWNWGASGGADETAKEVTFREIKQNAVKLKTLLIGAAQKNPTFVRALENATIAAYSRLSARLPKTGKYYKGEDGKYSNVPSSTAFADSKKKLSLAVEVYYTLWKAGLIDHTATTGINPINLYTGEFYAEEVPETDSVTRLLKIPTSGIFTVNKRPRGSYYQRTFTGVDAQCLASTGNVVSNLDGLTSISWSVHRGKSTPRNLGKPSPAIRSRGARTIAGTMIFTVSDHHPLLDLLPADTASFRKLEFVNSQKQWRPVILSDQLPPFDLTVVLTNEYGNSAILIIYGIDIVDEGSVLSTDNLLTEVTLQYVAVGMDPIQEVGYQDDGSSIIIDPYGITKAGGSEFFRRREVVMQGFSYSDYEEAYDSYYRSALKLK